MKDRVWKKYLLAACAAATTLVSASLPIVLAGNSAYATTTGAVPPWEPDSGSATPYGNIVFYDASGNQVTSGTNLSNPFAYAVATTPADAGSTKAVLSFGLPQKGVVAANWNQTPESGTTTFTSLPTSTPAVVKAFAPTYPVVVSTANISAWLGGHTPDTNQDYANTIEVRLQDTAIFGTTTYWDTDIGYNNTSSPVTIDETVNGGSGSITIPANSWVQIFPSVTSTATAVSSTLASPQSPGTPIPLTATVTPSSTGSVSFYNNGTFLSNVAVSGGTAHYTDSSPSAGTNAYTASFVPGTAPGDETGLNTTGASIVGGSTSPPFDMNIVAPATTTTVASSTSGTSVVGQTVTYTATVAPQTGTGTPDGQVTFKDGTTAICSGVTLASGSATCTPTAYAATGTHGISAVYLGSASFQGSTSSTLTQTVSAANTTTSLAAAPNPASQNGNVLLTATVSAVAPGAGNPTGTVDFNNGTTTICTGALAVGAGGDQATCNTSFASTGTDSLTAVYVTDGNYNGSTSSTVSEQVNPATTTTVTSSTSGSSVVGQAVTYTASVAPQSGPGTPGGTVTFDDGTTTICSGVVLSSGSATCTPPTYKSVGTHTIHAVYSGSASFGGSTSAAFTQTVNQAGTTIAIVSSANPVVAGQTATYTATISTTSPGTGTPDGGTVAFDDSSTAIPGCGAVPVDASTGQARCAVSYPAAGSHSISATYSGDGNFAGSGPSNAIVEDVTVPPCPTGPQTASGGPWGFSFQAAGGHLCSVGPAGSTDWGVALAPGTSPSEMYLPGGGEEVAFQGYGGDLWTVGTAGWTDWHAGMASGTSPSMVRLTTGGFQIAFQANNGDLWTVGTAGWTDWHLGVAAGTSPSVVALPNGGFEVAFQANNGELWTVGTAGWTDWHVGMAPGTNPSAFVPSNGGFEVAFQAAGGALWSVGYGGWTDWNVGLAPGTSPAAVHLSNGGYQIAFQGYGGAMWSVGTAGWTDWGLGMAPATSPSIAPLSNGGFEIAFQAYGGHLWTVGTGGWTNWGLSMASSTSPSIS